MNNDDIPRGRIFTRREALSLFGGAGLASPGWYSGRAVHIHFKVRVTIAGAAHEFTSQLFFNDALTTSIHTASPYNTDGVQ